MNTTDGLNNLKRNKMKNLFLLPIDKPSGIYLIKANNKLGITSDNPFYTENMGSGTQNQHIYITSYKEIIEGDWIYCKKDNLITKTKTKLSFMLANAFKTAKKVILTTDQDLIKDGVQAIDDEFLEWFVKNPSCEEVKIIKDLYLPQSNGKISDGKITHEISLDLSQNTLPYYKIIIPSIGINSLNKQD